MNINKINEILITRSSKVIVTSSSEKTIQSWETVLTASANFMEYGYVFGKKLIEVLQTLEESEFYGFIRNTEKVIKESLGAHKKYSPMYSNFPHQVMEASDAELYWNAILHYFGDAIGVRILPKYDELARPELNEKLKKAKVLDLGSIDDYLSLVKGLIGANTSISDSDKVVVSIAVANGCDVIPENIPYKENLTFATAEYFMAKRDPSVFLKHYNNATDILRLAVALSGGDVSLAANTKFVKISRPQRRFMLRVLDGFGNLEEDMLRHEGQWIRLGEFLHPGEFKDQFKSAFKAFQAIRNHRNGTHERIRGFNSKIEDALKKHDVRFLVSELHSRPGIFARRLDHLLRTSPSSSKQILKSFESIASDVAVPVLLQTNAHFKGRNDLESRTVFPKGAVAKMQIIDAPEKINNDSVKNVVSITNDALRKNFAQRSALGKVWVDPVLMGSLVPFSQRSASKALKTIVRGSRVPFGTKDYCRFFIYWHDIGDQRVDLDLSASTYDNDWKDKGQIWYGNLRENVGLHSGDITSAPNGACEFIDVNIAKALKSGIRYIGMHVNSFTGQKFTEMEAFGGWMDRDNPETGKIFDARTVAQKVDLTSDATATLMMFIDVVLREIIWVDMPSRSSGRYSNILSDSAKIKKIGPALADMKKFNLYDLFTLHGEARGTLVNNREDADIVYAFDGDVTPYDFEKIASEYL